MTIEEVENVNGGITGPEAADLILAVASLALTPITIGVAAGAAGGLLIAHVLAHSK